MMESEYSGCFNKFLGITWQYPPPLTPILGSSTTHQKAQRNTLYLQYHYVIVCDNMYSLEYVAQYPEYCLHTIV